MIAARLEAVLADQRTNTTLLALDGIERIEASRFDVEPGSGIAIEQRERALGRVVPFAVDGSAQATDASQLGLNGPADVVLRRRTGRQRGDFGLLRRFGRRICGRGGDRCTVNR